MKITIVKVGGAVVENDAMLQEFLNRFNEIDGAKVLVHGGGRSATAMAERLGIETKMVDGRRITDAETIKVVTMVYAGLVNKNIVASLQARGINAAGLTGADLNCIVSDKRPLKNGIDYGYVGDVRKVDNKALMTLIENGIVPVLSPITHNGDGLLLNTNADTIASEVAKALAIVSDVTLTYCFEKQGVLLDPDDDDSVIYEINSEYYRELVHKGIISGGMLPKMENAFEALNKGVKRVVITNAVTLDSGTTITL